MNVPCSDGVEIFSVPALCEDDVDFEAITNLMIKGVSKVVQVDK